MFKAVRMYPGYGMATLIYNNLATQFNIGHSNGFNHYIIGYLFNLKKKVFIESTAKNEFQIRIVQ